MSQYPFIHQLNRPEPTVLFGQLPVFYQEFVKALWEQGVLLEVYGQKSRKWQPVHQHNMTFGSKQYYRLKGDVHYACQKEGRKHLEVERGVFITDPVALPQNSICYMADGYALSATVTPY